MLEAAIGEEQQGEVLGGTHHGFGGVAAIEGAEALELDQHTIGGEGAGNGGDLGEAALEGREPGVELGFQILLLAAQDLTLLAGEAHIGQANGEGIDLLAEGLQLGCGADLGLAALDLLEQALAVEAGVESQGGTAGGGIGVAEGSLGAPGELGGEGPAARLGQAGKNPLHVEGLLLDALAHAGGGDVDAALIEVKDAQVVEAAGQIGAEGGVGRRQLAVDVHRLFCGGEGLVAAAQFAVADAQVVEAAWPDRRGRRGWSSPARGGSSPPLLWGARASSRRPSSL